MVRPRLLAASLAVALVVGVVGGWALHRFGGSDVDAEVVLAEPGEYQQPLDDPDADPSDALAEGRPFPDVVLHDADDVEISSGSLVDGPMVVNVWFSTCPPCARELADFAEVHAEVGDRIRFVGVNPIDTPATMIDFAAERGVTYELLRDTDGAFVDAVGVVSFPRTYLVDTDGRIVGDHGELDADELRQHLEEHF